MEGLEKIRFEMSYNKKNYHSAGFGRKVILVIFVIFELGPDSESLCNALPSESAVGLCHFFSQKTDSEVLGTKKEKSYHGASTLVLEKSHYGALNCN